ncbi:hypothetical protein Pmani_024671 [Petrolisthes manimaculis]|uniref:Uncharacterized protein n=1 Tax=Petrolisthes manimaculis TaxID=1843537 RepID=A0AAE1P8Q5_9EUCA|nr:hypothetical protein Pmani_024671 [Petrolisthes manimaculis]
MKVGVSVQVRNIAKIDEADGVLWMEINLRVKWRDIRLQLPPDLEPNNYIPLDPAILSDLWVPDIYIVHSSEAKTPSVLTSVASVWMYGDATVDYSGNMFVLVSCRMKYAWFPRDHQVCDFRMESFAYTLERNEYVWAPPGLEVSDNIISEQFLISFQKIDPYTRTQQVYGTYPALAFRVHLTRRLSYVLLQVYLPSGLFVVMSFVSLLVPPEAIPGRMTLCITTILTMSTLLGVAMQSMPRVSYVRAIDVWLLSCLAFVSIVLLEFGVVIKLLEIEKHSGGNDKKPAPVSKKIFKETTVQPLDTHTHENSTGWSTPNPPPPPSGIRGQRILLPFVLSRPSSKRVDQVSLVVLPGCFLLFNVIYWWWFLTGSKAAMPNHLGSHVTEEEKQ